MEDIREIMKNDLKKIGIDLDKDNRYQYTSFNSEDMRRKSPYGEFIFADERGYHYICYGWRESEHVDKTFDYVDDLLYYIYRIISTFLPSTSISWIYGCTLRTSCPSQLP